MELIKHKEKYYIKSETGYREVLASTNSELVRVRHLGIADIVEQLPQIHEEFLPIYVKAYNEGNILTEVSVEYENDYPIGGFAPGGYSCTCVDCKDTFLGDKRAVQCESCALDMYRQKTRLKLTDNNEVVWSDARKYTQSIGRVERAVTITSVDKKMYSREEFEAKVVEGMRVMNAHIIKTTTMRGQDAKQFAKEWIKDNLK